MLITLQEIWSFTMFETIEKVLKAVKKKYFSWLKRPSRTATKNYVENNFR